MYESYSASTQPRPRKGPKVSVLFRHADGLQHSAGVNALTLSQDGAQLFTASRDATVKRWDVGSQRAQQQPGSSEQGSDVMQEASASFLGHCDWVNDALLLNSGVAASCSSDRTIRLWNARATGQQRMKHTLSQHSDYVMALAVAGPASAPLLASAGLRAELLLWDIASTMMVSQQDGAMQPKPAEGVKGSVYAIAMDAMGSLLVAGSPESAIRVIDPRTGGKCFKLKGHTDNVRCLMVNTEGTLCLSGSSDHSIRLWDLGQQRCLHTYTVHTDSVWALQASPDFSVAYSGGRDGCCYRTNLEQASTELLFKEQQPISALALNRQDDTLWCSTTASEVRGWQPSLQERSGARWDPPEGPSTSKATPGGSFPAASSAVMRSRQTFASGATAPPPLLSAPHTVLAGNAPLVKCSILSDRQRVLTQALDGTLALWDVTLGTITDTFPPGSDFAAVERQLFRPAHVPAWFAADCKLGSLAMHLDTPSCFTAETYAMDLGFNVSDDVKLNYGEHLLKAVFAAFAQAAEAQWVAQGHGQLEGASAFSAYFEFNDIVTPLVMSESPVHPRSPDRAPWCWPASELGQEAVPSDLVPRWVADAVLRTSYPQSPETKCAFLLKPSEESGLPGMQHPRLNAPRILRMQKVVTYAQARLHELGYRFSLAPVFWDASSREQPSTSISTPQENGSLGSRTPMSASPANSSSSGGGSASSVHKLELVCADVAVPLDLSLAAVKAFIWRRPDDMSIIFRPRDPMNPAPLPQIRPPS